MERIFHNAYTPKTIEGSMFSFRLIVRASESEGLVCQSGNVQVRQSFSMPHDIPFRFSVLLYFDDSNFGVL
jgi:hypothetical protein